jgi:hypothetical protein
MVLGGIFFCWTFHTSTRPVVGQVIEWCYVGCTNCYVAFQAADGTQLGRYLEKNVGRKWRGSGCDGLPNCVDVIPKLGSAAAASPWVIIDCRTILRATDWTNVTHSARKAGLSLGKDVGWSKPKAGQTPSTWNKYCRLQDSNPCPLAWQLGKLPLDHLGIDWYSTWLVHCLRRPSRSSFKKTEENLGKGRFKNHPLKWQRYNRLPKSIR